MVRLISRSSSGPSTLTFLRRPGSRGPAGIPTSRTPPWFAGMTDISGRRTPSHARRDDRSPYGPGNLTTQSRVSVLLSGQYLTDGRFLSGSPGIVFGREALGGGCMADDPEDYHPSVHPPDRRPTRNSEPGEPPEIRVGLYCAVQPARSFSPSGRSSPLGETCRYRVWRVTPSSVQRSPTLVSGWPIEAVARRSLAGVILKGDRLCGRGRGRRPGRRWCVRR